MARDEVQSLLLRMHRGDELAAETLWARFGARLTAYARALLPSGHQGGAEDVVQGVFIRVLRMRRGQLRSVRDGSAFLFRVTRNQALNTGRTELREHARRRALAQRDAHERDDEAVARVLRAIEGLAFEQREVLLLRYIGGLSIAQAGEALGIKRDTAASRGRLGMAKLRAALMENEQETREVHDG